MFPAGAVGIVQAPAREKQHLGADNRVYTHFGEQAGEYSRDRAGGGRI